MYNNSIVWLPTTAKGVPYFPNEFATVFDVVYKTQQCLFRNAVCMQIAFHPYM